jgi:hypothetical protein
MGTVTDARSNVLADMESSHTTLAEYQKKVKEMEKKISSLTIANKKLGTHL